MANELKLSNPIVVGSFSSDPGTGYNGEIYYNTSSNTFRVFQNGAWTQLATGSGSLTGEFLLQNNIIVGDSGNLSASTDTSAQGDVLAASTSGLTIKNSAVTNAKLANMAANTLKGNNTGSPAAPLDLTVSQVNSMLGTILASGAVDFSGNQSMAGNRLTNLGNAVNPQDAVPLSQAQALLAALSWKNVVRTATTTVLPSYTYANGTAGVGATITATANGALPAIDGVTLVFGDRVLVKNEISGNQPFNGIYDVTQVGDASHPFILTRDLDSDTAAELVGEAVQVGTEASTQAGFAYRQATAAPITVGTSNLVYTNWATGISYNFRNGLALTGSNVDVAPGDNSLTATPGSLVVKEDPAGAIVTGASGIKVQTDGSTTQISSNQVAVKLDTGATTGNIVSSGSGLKNQLESSNPTLKISANQLGVNLDAARAITAASGGIGVNVDNSTIDIAGNAIEVKSGGITNTQVNASAAIAYSKLAALNANRVPTTDATGHLVDNDSTDKELVANSLRRSKTAGSYVQEEYIHSTSLLDNSGPTSVAALQFAHGTYAGEEIAYVIETGAGTPDLRIGTLRVVSNGTNTSFTDMFTETADCGVTWSITISGSNTLVNYTTSSQGTNRTLRADRKLFLK